jgi:threonine/homoserine/homoserine lactone efflux protein
MALHTWLIYAMATSGLSLMPGPNGLLALTHGALHGPRLTLFTISGGVLGFLVLLALSMFGIGAVLGASAQALTLMKWIGGAYLVWLGLQVWRAPAPELQATGSHAPVRHGWSLFTQGFSTAVINPKVVLFFAAFLPPFIDPHRSLATQFIVMATTFAVIEFIVESAVALLASGVRGWLQRSGKKFNRVCGAMFALFGAGLAAGS